MELEVKTINKDGGVVFQGTLNSQQVQFILGIGINFLLANGAELLTEDDEEDDSFVMDAPVKVQ